MKIQKKRRNTMSTTEVVKSSKEYMTVPIAELIESNTNPRKVFDQSFLEELAESIRNRGILSPLLVRPVNNHLEIVAGAQANHFLPAPPYGRRSQTCEATIWNRTDADGSVLCIALPATRTDVPPCKAAWFAKPERPPRLSDGREGPDTLQEGGCC